MKTGIFALSVADINTHKPSPITIVVVCLIINGPHAKEKNSPAHSLWLWDLEFWLYFYDLHTVRMAAVEGTELAALVTTH